MRHPTSRVAHLHVADRRHELAAVVENVLPGLNQRTEEFSLYLLATVFWGLVLYFALMAF